MALALGDVLVLFSAIVVAFIVYVKHAFNYWKKRNVPYIKPEFPFGNFGNPLITTTAFGEKLREQYVQLKSQGHKYGGCYVLTSPTFITLDPDLIKSVMAKDFHQFVSRGVYYNEKHDPLSAHLFAIDGKQWKNLRHKLTPTFTSGKMKMMLQILVECSYELEKDMNSHCGKRQVVPIKDVLQNFTTDVIGSCAFGIDCNSFTNPDAKFVKMGKRVFQQSPLDKVKRIFSFAFPSLAKKMGLTVTAKEVSDFYLDVVKQTVNYREENNVVRKDFMQILIDLKNNTDGQETSSEATNLTINQIAAQAFVFFLAGFETSSTTMTFCLFELAQDEELQQKVRDDVNRSLKKHDGQLTYEAIQDMKYMDQVIEGKKSIDFL